MSDETKDKVEGKADEVAGKVKSAIGNITGDDKTKAEGKMDEAAGKVKQGVADVKEKVGDMVDKVTGDDKK